MIHTCFIGLFPSILPILCILFILPVPYLRPFAFIRG
jgi:hypothetical protein